jgi:SecD/SecF fusion protein
MFGIAAILALVHDTLITLGCVAFSAYLVQFLPGVASALMIEPFKISLTVVAAFLTLIGYSLNDTIVFFDRIREVRGKSPYITGPMIDRSVNETLSRTFNTFLTTFIVMFVLYVAGGASIHAFAFCLLVGLISGTYSSIYIAAPALLWLERSPSSTPPRGSAPAQPVKASR